MWYHSVNNFHGRDESIPFVAQCKRNTAGGNSALSYCHHVQQAFSQNRGVWGQPCTTSGGSQ